jgi:shikimate kinase
MPGKLARCPGLFLAGFMGSGKSTVGLLLAEELGWDFVDLDTIIEQQEGMPIARIFADRGEPAFRQLEHDALREQTRAAERGKPRVVAVGGGAYAQERNRTLLEPMGTVVWLDAPIDVLLARIAHETHRPLAQDPVKFAELYEARRDSYALADFRVDATGKASAVAARILGLPLW